MATILNRQVTFSTNGTVTAAGLHNLIDETEIYAGIITTQPVITSVGSSDQLLIADADLTPTSAPRRVTVGSMFNDALNNGIYTNSSFTGTLTAGSFVGPLNGSVNGTIVSTAGTIATLNSTTGTIATLNSTTGTIANLSATTSTFLGTITGSTNVVNIGSGQIYKDASGNVGIGTTSPSQKLTVFSDDVLGGVLVTGSNAPCIRLNDTTDGTSYSAVFAQNGGVLYLSADSLNTAANSSMRFEVDQTERLRIDSSGNVGINKTSPDTSLHILQKAADANNGLKIQEDASASKYYRTLYVDSNGILRFNNGSNEATITLAGSFVNASDSRLKKDITEIKYGLNEVMESMPRSFKRVDVAGEYFGFIAQELKNVLPEAVSGDSESQLGVDYGSLVAVAFKAIQELKSENDSLKSRIEALEAA